MIKEIPEIPSEPTPTPPPAAKFSSPPSSAPVETEQPPLIEPPVPDTPATLDSIQPDEPSVEESPPQDSSASESLSSDPSGSLRAVQFGKSLPIQDAATNTEETPPNNLPAKIPVRRPPEPWFITIMKAVGIFLLTFAIVLGFLNGPALWNRASFWIRHLGQEPPSPPLAFLPKLQDRAVTLQEIKQEPSAYFDPALQLAGYSLADLGDNQLLIPKIEVNVPIIWKNEADERSMIKALEQGVAHYGFTALPSDGEGNVFLTGHSSYLPWAPGKYKSVFANLDRLDPGDQLAVSFRGVVYLYEVTEKKVVKPSELSVLDQSPEPTLTMMTCVPIGTNLNRLVVVADLISAKPTQPIPLPPPEHTLPAAIFYYLPS